jgi:hypothetical protein
MNVPTIRMRRDATVDREYSTTDRTPSACRNSRRYRYVFVPTFDDTHPAAVNTRPGVSLYRTGAHGATSAVNVNGADVTRCAHT